jgi:hypothetical protein
MTKALLSTTDNPYNPFEDWDRWYAWDTSHGYNTSQLLARVCVLSPDMSEPDQTLAITQAMEEIVEFNLSGMHTMVTQ